MGTKTERPAFVTSIALVSLATWQPFARAADDRNSVVAAVFEKYCLHAPLDLAALDRSAAEARYEIVLDRTIPLPNGQAIRQKNWIVPSSVGPPTLLTSNDVGNGSLHVTGCGIAPDLEGAALETALSDLPSMGSRQGIRTLLTEGT